MSRDRDRAEAKKKCSEAPQRSVANGPGGSDGALGRKYSSLGLAKCVFCAALLATMDDATGKLATRFFLFQASSSICGVLRQESSGRATNQNSLVRSLDVTNFCTAGGDGMSFGGISTYGYNHDYGL